MGKRNFAQWINNRQMSYLPPNGKGSRSLWGFGKSNPRSNEDARVHGVMLGEAPMDGVIRFDVTQTPNVTIVEATLVYDCYSPNYSLDGLTTYGEARRNPVDEFNPTAGFELALSRALKEMKTIIAASGNGRVHEASRERFERIESQEAAAKSAKQRKGLRSFDALIMARNRHPSNKYGPRNNGKVNA